MKTKNIVGFFLATVISCCNNKMLRTEIPKLMGGMLVTFMLLSCPLIVMAATNNPITLNSPDGNIHLVMETKTGKLTYAVSFKNTMVIEPSVMGLVVNGNKLGTGISIGKSAKYSVNESYATLGVHSMAVNKCNGLKISVNAGKLSFTVDARAYNDGVAFRYIVPNQGDAVIEKDLTQFKIPAASMVWSQPNIKYYEGQYSKKNTGDLKAGELAGPPVTIELPGNAGYAAITEGGLTDFAGMSLIADGDNGFTANLSGNAKKTGTIESPWRIIEIGKDLNTLVNCDIITNVSPASDKKLFPQGVNTDWIKPGRCVWSWLAKTRFIRLDNMEHFSDLAAQLGFEYNLVDEGWGNWKDSTRDKWDMMKELVDYSAKKGVKIWVWKAYPDRNGIDGINTPEKRKNFFKKCQEIGIAGLKIDFFDSEAQQIVDFYQDALRDAADYHLMIDFHGANKPTGEMRTWPNELTREAIRGLENHAPWAPGNSTLPFTRYLAGPADFTPMNFDARIGEVTWAHHVATMAIFTSPLMCIGADPQSILDNPCKLMIQSIPVTWDETIVLPQSKIGNLVLYARRKGTTWFIAALNGISQAQTINVGLSFLQPGNHALNSLNDDPLKQAGVRIENSVVSSKTILTINLNPAGGFVGMITSAK